MAERSKISNNFFWLLSAEMSGKLFQFLYIKILSSVLGPENFGIFSWAQSNTAYFLMLITLGLDTFGTREVSRDPDKKSHFTSSILSLRLLLSLLTYLIMLLYIYFLDKSLLTKMTLAASGLMLFANSIMLDWVYQGLEKMRIAAIRSFGVNLLNFLGVWLIITEDSQLVLSIIIIGFSQILNAAFLIFHFMKFHGPIKIRIDFQLWKKYLKEALPIGLSMMMIGIFSNSDILMLGFLRENFEEESALLYAAVRIVTFFTIPAQLLLKSFFPVLSRTHLDSNRSHRLSQYHLISLTLGLFLFQFVYFFSSDLILLQFNSEYLEASTLLIVLSPRLFFAYLNMNLSAPLLAWGYQKQVFYALTTAAVSNIALNFVLIPEYGPMGAIISTLIAEGITFVYYYTLVYKIEKTLFASNFIKAIMVFVFTALSGFFLIGTLLPAVVSAIFNIFAFVGLIFIFKVISLSDIKQMLGR